VNASGIPDFIGSKEVCAVSFVCLKCNKPCDVAGLTSKKRIQTLRKRMVFYDRIFQKLFELLDGITIHPIKGVILTPKKKRQLVELQKMEQALLKQKKSR